MENVVILRNAKFVEYSYTDGSKQMVGMVRGDSFVNVNIPTEPNPRQFLSFANPHYKDMVKTLKSEPHMFSRKNSGGITMFVSACDSNGDGTYSLKFEDGDGIANGGHTYHALKVHGRENSLVKVTLEIGLNKDHVSAVASALNLSKKLQNYSLQNKEGVFDWHKTALGTKADHIIYHEGDVGHVEVKEAMAYLNLFKHGEDGLDMLTNIEQSEHANVQFLNRINKPDGEFQNQLKWLALDVHNIMIYTIFFEKFSIQLHPLKKALGQNWLKSRGVNKKRGIMKGLGLLIVAGLASVGVELNKNGIVQWKKPFKTHEARREFISELFSKVFDVIQVEDGSASDIIRQDSVRKKVLKHAKMIALRMSASQEKAS